ncbi:MAG: hypothetical protein JWN74_1886 [Acidobacteriaceae bacterium]|nr:hypothetical protein [Acidobacteriaceae bacterium]
MKYALIALLLTVIAFGQDTPATGPNDTNSTAVSTPAQSIPTDQANVQKAKAIIDQAIQALGGQAYLNASDMRSEGRGYSFHHGQPNSLGTVFWRFRKFPDKDRVELTKKRDVIEIYNGDKGYEITYRGVRPLDQKDELDAYLRRRHYSLDLVLREWLNQPGVALFYEGQTVAAQKQTEQVTVMNNKNEAVTLYIDTITHLPVKKSFSWRDPADKQRNVEEEIFDNYRPVQNIMTPFDTTRLFNSEMSAQSFLTGASYNQGLSDSLFDPQAANASKRH